MLSSAYYYQTYYMIEKWNVIKKYLPFSCSVMNDWNYDILNSHQS